MAEPSGDDAAPESVRRRVPSRVRWIAVWLLIALWIVAIALDLAGNFVHLLLIGAIAIIVLELLTEEEARELIRR